MIVIFSTREDITTTETMRWLRHLGAPNVMRINDEDQHQRPVKLVMTDDSFQLSLAGKEFSLKDISAVWYRKGTFWFKDLYANVHIQGHDSLAKHLSEKLVHESRKIRQYFHFLVSSHSRILGSYDVANMNKMVVLSMARKVGLTTPSFMVSNCRDAILNRIDERGPQITKAAADCLYYWDFDESRRGYFTYTEKVAADAMQSLPPIIPSSFVQDEVTKAYEVRSFYLDGDIYSAAIYSQEDDQTRTDYRKYNQARPNRNVPYDLPDATSHALRQLFSRLNLNTGSVDFMVDELGVHHFLEINPSGQFGGISHSCNYDLSKRVAEWLIGGSA